MIYNYIVFQFFIISIYYMRLFNIVKYCQNQRDKCEVNYTPQNGSGNDSTITRRMRFAERIQTQKYKRITRITEVPGPGIPVVDALYQPNGQVGYIPRDL